VVSDVVSSILDKGAGIYQIEKETIMEGKGLGRSVQGVSVSESQEVITS